MMREICGIKEKNSAFPFYIAHGVVTSSVGEIGLFTRLFGSEVMTLSSAGSEVTVLSGELSTGEVGDAVIDNVC